MKSIFKKAFTTITALSVMATCGVAISACNEKDNYATVSSYNELVKEIENGGKIRLDKDIELTAPITVAKEVVLDLNSKKITEKVSDDEYTALFYIKNGANKFTITGNGSIVSDDNTIFRVGDTTQEQSINGNLVIENGSFKTGPDAFEIVYVVKGTAEILDGTYEAPAWTNGKYYTLNVNDTSFSDNTAKIEVSGGKYYNYNPANSESEYPASDYLKGGKDKYTITTDEEEVEDTTIYIIKKK